jgi:S-DNA-T family DNA segregation ATPase FtsK/SpoIIIE
VNPFAQTAGPGQKRPSDYGPPPSVPPELATTTPGVGAPKDTPQVSPLAVSNAASSRGAFANAIAGTPGTAPLSAVGSNPPVAADSSPAGVKRVAGTQMMPSSANPGLLPGGVPSGAPAPGSAAPKRQDRTQLLGVFPGIPPRPGGAPAPSSVAPSAMAPSAIAPSGSTPSAGAPSAVAPSAVIPSGGAFSGDAGSPFAATALPAHSQAPVQPPMPAIPSMHVGAAMPPMPPPQPPQPPQPWMEPQPSVQPQPSAQPQPSGWNPGAYVATPQPLPQQQPYGGAPGYPPPAPPPPMQPPGYVFGYSAGSRVHVTWSNGQRYPGTVQQVSGSQCLVVFPDGQHHWVEMQYVAPA